MNTFLTEVRQTLVPRGEVKHGPLPPLLVAMTLVTGLVDAFSYLALGHVFVANMTGNVVFLAFALAGASGFSILASLVALGFFILGSLLGGILGSRLGKHRGHLLSVSAALQTLLLSASAVLAALSGNPVPLTLTIVGIGADSRLAGGSGSKSGRRLIAVAAMFVGALIGSLLIFHVSIVYPLVSAFVIMASVAVTTRVLSRNDPAWVSAS